ncbi:hypothetical protein JVT61DRAFT_13828 [Boletus reticuloceps]|uniref:Uncharacterized protein n=1 Tax=Boletus reticuloceps TaxID=495285 RepID=A0A8I3AD81_9AGAM|nr:hypothetical protein JVT61DRAFT_13828 [Boletus reticuloceps]
MPILPRLGKIKEPPVVAPTVRYPERAASRHPFSPLPDYETSQALAFRDFNESQVTLYKPPPRRRIFDSRLWRAAISALLVYIFLTLVIGIPIVVHKEHENQQKYPDNPLSYDFAWPNKNLGAYYPGSTRNITIPDQPGIIPVCNNWTAVEYFGDPGSPTVLAFTEQYVSPNGQFSLASNATCSSNLDNVQGVFYTGINPNQTVQDAVLSVVMQSSSPSVFNRTFACFAVTNNFTDLALYLPDDLASTDNILYNITLLFPQAAVPSQIDSFTTILPMFDQHFSFDGNVTIDRVSIAGAASPVTVDSIQANRLLVDTSLEPVTGTFHVSDSLLISTILAPIVANISLYNDPKSQFPTSLDVHTGNGNLTVNVTILAPNKDPPLRPNFVANLRTFSGSLSTSFLHDPTSPPTAVQLHAFNDLGPSNVILDSLFEGIFQVSTKQAAATVTQGNASVTDPWVPGLPRTMVVGTNLTARSYGWIGWGNMETPCQQGEVLVDSSLADVTLSFLG